MPAPRPSHPAKGIVYVDRVEKEDKDRLAPELKPLGRV